MGETYDGIVDSGPRTAAQKQSTAIEMQKLLDVADRQMSAAERDAIGEIRSEVFDLKRETARVSLQNVDNLKTLTPSQVVTLIEANYKTESGKRWIQYDDGLVVVKQLALDVLGRYDGGVDNVWGVRSQKAERDYRAEKGLPAQGSTDRLLQCFVDDIRANVAGTSVPGARPGVNGADVQVNVAAVETNINNTVAPLSVDEAVPSIPPGEALYKTGSALTLPENVSLKKEITPVDMMSLSEVMAKNLAENYRKYSGQMELVANQLGMPPSVLANLLVKENPYMVKGRRTTIGQMDRAAWQVGAAFARSKGLSVGDYDRYRNNAAEQIKASAGLMAYHYNNCQDWFISGQLYHTGSDLTSNKTARYYARYNPAILRSYNTYVTGPSVTTKNITADQYKIGAKLYYAAADYA